MVGATLDKLPKAVTEREDLWSTCTGIGFFIGVLAYRSAGLEPHVYEFGESPSLWLVWGWTIGGSVIGYFADALLGKQSAGSTPSDNSPIYGGDTLEMKNRINAMLAFNQTQNPDDPKFHWIPVSSPGPVNVQYVNSRGKTRSITVDPDNIELNGRIVKVWEYRSDHAQMLRLDRIHNPEVLGFHAGASAPISGPPLVSANDPGVGDCPECSNSFVRPWEGKFRCWSCGYVFSKWSQPNPQTSHAEPVPEPPAEPEFVPDLNDCPECSNSYVRRWDGKYRCWSCGYVFSGQPQDTDSLPPLPDLPSPEPVPATAQLDISLADGAPPPILEPKAFIVGEATGLELIYSRKNGDRGVIYFVPGTAQIIEHPSVGQRVLVQPKGLGRQYSIAYRDIQNPEVLRYPPEIDGRVLPPLEPEPEPVLPELAKGTCVVIEESPMDSYEAVQIIRNVKSDLNTFEIIEALKVDSKTYLDGFSEDDATELQAQLETAGCQVGLLEIDPDAPEPLPTPDLLRDPTEEEFHEIRFGLDEDRIKPLITGSILNLNALDADGVPLIHGSMDPHITRLLISYGANPSATDVYGNTALHTCMEPRVIEELFEAGLRPDTANHAGATPLHVWAAEGRVAPVECLLIHEANPVIADHKGNTPLEAARQANQRATQSPEANHARVIELLLEFTPDSTEPPVLDRRPPTEEEFHEIRMGTDRRRVIHLITGGELDLDAKDDLGYPLIHGCQKEEIAKHLINQHINLHATDAQGNTALHHCEDSAVQELLVEQGVPVDTPNRQGETPLHTWATRGVFEPVKTLLHFGAATERTTPQGHTPLQLAQQAQAAGSPGEFAEIIALLTPEPSPEEALPPVIEETERPPVIESTSKGRTPTKDEFYKIRFACEYDFKEAIQIIESGQIDVNALDEFDRPLVFGVGHPQVIGLLIDHGADIHVKSSYQSGILHECYQAEACEMLIQFGVDPNSRDRSGNTPLHECMFIEVAKVLVDHGAEIDAKCDQGITPLIEAAAMGNYDLVKFLIEKGADIHHQSNSSTENRKSPLIAAEKHIWDGTEDHQVEARKNCEKIADLLRSLGATR